jgi:hypothetical protein
MSRRVAQAILYPLAALLTCAGASDAQGDRPFAAAALMAGPQGFARPPVNSALVGAYAYAPVSIGLLGLQGGWSPTHPGQSRAVHALVTAGLPVYRGQWWQTYPFLGLGTGVMRASAGSDAAHTVYAAGLGFDVYAADRGPVTVGSRVGYLTRSAGDDNSMAYVTVSVGVARH